jgi:hypothetical protein
MTGCATDVVAPMLAAAKVVVLVSTCVTFQTDIRDGFWRQALERKDLALVAAGIDVSLPRTMTLLAACDLAPPAIESRQFAVGCARKVRELFGVTVFACRAARITRLAIRDLLRYRT